MWGGSGDGGFAVHVEARGEEPWVLGLGLMSDEWVGWTARGVLKSLSLRRASRPKR